MKVNIRLLQLALLNGGVHVLDLDSGIPISYQMIAEGMAKKPQHFVRIPWESQVPIYQAYLNNLFSIIPELGDPYALKDYPKYEEAVLNCAYFDEYEYINKAHNFIENVVSGLIYYNRRKGGQQIPQDFPTFDEYKSSYMLQFAKEWCEKQRYEWYEE